MHLNPDSCPHCGGTNGFYAKSIVKFQTNYEWNGDSCGGEVGDQVRGGSAHYCYDCDRNVSQYVTRADQVAPYTGER